MVRCKVNFDSLEWQSPLPGARFKSFEGDGRRVRLVEFSRDFVEPDWCTKGHIGVFWLQDATCGRFFGGECRFGVDG